MSSNTSIVSSAADCRGKPQPARSAGNTHSSHRERKESEMFINGLSGSRGFSPATAALAAVACVGLAGTASANLITNGDFSANASAYINYPGYSNYYSNPSNPTGWTINSASAGVSGPDTGYSGQPFAPTSTAGVRDFEFSQNQGTFISQDVATAAGRAYTLAFDGAARANETTDVLEVILTDVASGHQISSFTPSVTDSGFTPFSLNFTADSGSTNIEFLNNTPSNTGPTVDVSNVSLVAVPEPATLGLVALGGLGLLLISRKRKARV